MIRSCFVQDPLTDRQFSGKVSDEQTETSMKETRRFAQGLAVSCILLLSAGMALGQNDPGVRGGLSNTGGGLQQQGIPIPHPPVISANPTTGNPIKDN